MKLRIRKSTTIVSASLASGVMLLALVFFFAGALQRPAFADTGNGRLITLHDKGEAQVFVTDKTTLREALSAAAITLDEHDAVEPALDENLVASSYDVNIYRARPVTIIDGATRQQVITPYQTAERIIKDAGVTLYAEDITKMIRSDDVVSDGAGLQLVITRAVPVTIDLFGKVTEIRTQADTVGAMLKEKGIDLGTDGRVSAPASTPVTSGMQLRVWKEGKQTITVDEGVAFETKEIKDADQPTGYKQVQTAGKDGKRTVTYEVEIQNGQEVARREIASITVEGATTQVVVIGSKPNFIPYTGGGSKTDWLTASNIPQESWGYADFLVAKESGWNPNARNKSSGACGLPQALPCSKLGPNWNDPIVGLNWMHGYVTGRYGGWQQAYTFWNKNHWY